MVKKLKCQILTWIASYFIQKQKSFTKISNTIQNKGFIFEIDKLKNLIQSQKTVIDMMEEQLGGE